MIRDCWRRAESPARALAGLNRLLLLALVMLDSQVAASPGAAPPATPAEPPAVAQDLDDEREGASMSEKDTLGIELGAEQGAFYLNAWGRVQTRISSPFDSDPSTVAELDSPPGSDLAFRRARLKAEGHLFDPRIGFYFEHELAHDHPLLDLRLDLDVRDDLKLRIGQYKVLYNRERIDSSGKQQFAERSVATYAFTIDRQRGAAAGWRFAAGTRADSRLFVGVYEGDGIDPGQRGDQPMWVARWQWQPLGRDLKFAQSDYGFTEQAALTLSLAGARVRGPYTRFSSSGGGQLDGFDSGGDERYTLAQWQQGMAWKYRGWSAQQEYHEKRIEDHEAGRHSDLSGGYAQFGKAWPLDVAGRNRPLELALRLARVAWRNTSLDRTQRERTLVVNWYLDGHDNKFTADVSRLDVVESGGADGDDTRFRLQWDFSF